MSETSKALIADAEAGLRRLVDTSASCSRSERACVAWALQGQSSPESLGQLAADATRSLGGSGERSYHDVSVLGFSAAAAVLDGKQVAALKGGIDWLCGRSAEIAGEPAPFFADAVSVLGFALGGRYLGAPYAQKVREWLLGFVPRAEQLAKLASWQTALFTIAVGCLEEGGPTSCDDDSVADVRTAMRALSLVDSEKNQGAVEKDETRALQILQRSSGADTPVVRAALQLSALAWIRRTAPALIPGRATADDIVEILLRVPAGLRRWTWESKARTKNGRPRKWYIDNEYHVQDLLYFLLAPIFPDLKDEENFPSVGQKNPRADLFVPSLKLIVEVKFLRSRDRTSKVIDEIASDASLYLAEASPYTSIIAFVWDDSRRSEEHPLLKKGLVKIRGIRDAVIISRPGAMN